MLIIILLIIVILCFLIPQQIEKYYEQFIVEHSNAVRKIKEINKEYSFSTISNFNMDHEYDNEVFFDNISTEDYLTYQLVYIAKDVSESIKSTRNNKALYERYIQEVKSSCLMEDYDTTELPKNAKRLLKTEEKVLNSLVLKPTVTLSITVKLWLTKINGSIITSKSTTFNEVQITDIIKRLKNKNGPYYLDQAIWDSICRVERGRVSNKMRFSIYQRDGYRCRKCGKSTQDLEIDHIFPISKGGKSTYDNLQTLCHRCNTLKSNTVEPGTYNPRDERYDKKRICPNCNVSLVKRRGKHGEFYGCPNYPNCKYTK